MSLVHADHRRHWAGLRSAEVTFEAGVTSIGGHPSMFEFERPYMARLARLLLADTPASSRVLDIGVGAGVFMAEVLRYEPLTYTGLEINEALAHRAQCLIRDWYDLGTEVGILARPWQHHLNEDEVYSAILLDTFPPPGYSEHDFRHLVSNLPRLLAVGGSFGFIQVGSLNHQESRHALVAQCFGASSIVTASDGFPSTWPHESEHISFYAYTGYSGQGE